MKTWIIEPHDPLIFRDGKPFGPTPGVRARSLPFPFPSTVAGGVRTQIGLNKDGVFAYSDDKLAELKKHVVRGPLLVQLNAEGGIDEWLLPAPADAALFKVEEQDQPERANAEDREQDKACKLVQFVPLSLPGEALTDLKAINEGSLYPVGPVTPVGRKPHKQAPLYWRWSEYKQWLLAPDSYCKDISKITDLGHSGPQSELRVHVAMDTNTRIGQDGALFDTAGLEFTHSGKQGDKQPSQVNRLALAVMTDVTDFSTSTGTLGSERRLVGWRSSQESFPDCPKELIEAITRRGACRLILLTPAYFANGYWPSWLEQERHGIKPKIKAIANKRPQVVSGWDIAGGKRKPGRRLTPAGTVFFLEFKEAQKEQIPAWINEIWFQSVSDDDRETGSDQYRLDGFGLAALGTWIQGEKPPMMKGCKDTEGASAE